MLFLEIFGYMVLGWVIYHLVTAWLTVYQIKRAIREAVDNQDIAAPGLNKIVRFEQVIQGPYNVILVFDEFNKFILQGNTQLEAEQLIKAKYPDKNIVVAENIEHKQTVDVKPV